MVVFGRPKGDRGSYKQWLENQIAPQVVFEILSIPVPVEMTGRSLIKPAEVEIKASRTPVRISL